MPKTKKPSEPLFDRTDDDGMDVGEVTISEATRKAKVAGPSKKELKAKIQQLNEEYRFLGPEANAGSGAAQTRRSEIARELRTATELLHLRERDVVVQVPRSVSGHPFFINDKKFPPGRHVVKASVAQVLGDLISKNRQAELARMQQNGYEVDLGPIGDKMRYAEINREI